MKVDGNSQVLRTVRLEQSMQENQVEQAKASDNDLGVSFEKNRSDLFIEQLEQAKKNSSAQDQTMGTEAKNAKSNLEILSNMVTERDLEEFKKHSEQLEEEELDVIVTVVEKIKTQLATYCEDFDSGMVNDISSEELAKLSNLTGNAVHVAKKLSQKNLPVTEDNVADTLSALELEEKIGELTDPAKEYCLKADLELTIENIYMAMHSGHYEGGAGYYADGSGYYAKAGAAVSIAELMPQIEKIIVQSGMQADDKTIGQAQWLIEKQLPLTKENLLKLQQLENISGDELTQEVVLDHIIDALLEGKRPTQAVLGEKIAAYDYNGQEMSVLERSEHAVSVIQNATDEQIKAVVAAGQDITIEKLEQAGTVTTVDKAVLLALQETDPMLITARRQMEEIRFQMTIESTAVMIRQGISVETESIQNLIQQLEMMEEQYYHKLLTNSNIDATQHNISLYKEIAAATARMGQAPAAVIGNVAFSKTQMSMTQVVAEGTMLAERYKQANEAYETVMTRPRTDMGDSIQKAFGNVDDILKDMGLEVNTANQRAVRILGYNTMEITEENIQRVKSADIEVTTMLSNMKPKAVLEMIREGYNPLDKTAQQINQKLAQYQDQNSQETFSEFLWNLEHSDGITAEERNTYIGIYRLMHQIEKSDGAVVGAVMEQGTAMTMRNLMAGVRTNKQKGMDYRIGDWVEKDDTETKSITNQIEEGFLYLGRIAMQVKSQMKTADWSNVNQEQIMDMSVESFADYVQETQKDVQDSNSYAREQLQMLQQACHSEEQVLSQLTNLEMPVTMNNIFAAEQLYGNNGELFKQLKNAVQSEDNELEQEFLENMANVEESFTDAQSAKSAYNMMTETAGKVVESKTETESITFEQMRSWKLLSGQVRLAASLSAKEDYHIPVEISGELTSVHVQFVHKESVTSKVAVSLETQTLGKIAAEFTEKNGMLEGYIQSESKETRNLFISNDEVLKQQIEIISSIKISKIDYVQYGQLDLAKFSTDVNEAGTDSTVSSASLYQVAKTVIGFVKTVSR